MMVATLLTLAAALPAAVAPVPSVHLEVRVSARIVGGFDPRRRDEVRAADERTRNCKARPEIDRSCQKGVIDLP